MWDACITPFLKKGDTIIIPGDFGIGFFDGMYGSEELFFDYIAGQDYMVLFCEGNHENFEKLNGYEISDWNGGKVHRIRRNLIHLMRGEVYMVNGKKIFVMGGGFSLDKEYRIPGKTWWTDEMPRDEEYKNATENLKKNGFKVDFILTHTAPADTVKYMSHLGKGIKNTVIEEQPLTGFLQWVGETTEYDKWYFGHFHIDYELWKNQYVLFDDIREFHSGKVIRTRC